MPKSLQELKERICAALRTTDSGMQQNVWNELYYRLDVCRVGSYIKYL